MALSYCPFYNAANKEHLTKCKLFSDAYIHHSFGYSIYFQLNWITFLKAMKKIKRFLFFCSPCMCMKISIMLCSIKLNNLPAFFLHSSDFLLNPHHFVTVCSIQLSKNSYSTT